NLGDDVTRRRRGGAQAISSRTGRLGALTGAVTIQTNLAATGNIQCAHLGVDHLLNSRLIYICLFLWLLRLLFSKESSCWTSVGHFGDQVWITKYPRLELDWEQI